MRALRSRVDARAPPAHQARPQRVEHAARGVEGEHRERQHDERGGAARRQHAVVDLQHVERAGERQHVDGTGQEPGQEQDAPARPQRAARRRGTARSMLERARRRMPPHGRGMLACSRAHCTTYRLKRPVDRGKESGCRCAGAGTGLAAVDGRERKPRRGKQKTRSISPCPAKLDYKRARCCATDRASPRPDTT